MAETIEIPTPDGPAEAYVARPGGDGPHPGVLFFMDAFGLRPRIEEMADRIASWGYVVVAPNVFHREGRAADLAPTRDMHEPGAREEVFKVVGPRVGRLTPDLARADIPAYLTALRALEGVADGPVGTTGYCMGARLAVRAAGLDRGVAAVGGFHCGGLATDDPDSPHLVVADSRAEYVFGHADHDRSMPPEAIARLGEALAAAGRPAVNEVCPGAAHGYTMADTSSYDEAATEWHFTALRDLLDRTLNAPAR